MGLEHHTAGFSLHRFSLLLRYQAALSVFFIDESESVTLQAAWPRMPWDKDNHVNYNHIHDVMQSTGDGGMIYTLGPQVKPKFRPSA